MTTSSRSPSLGLPRRIDRRLFAIVATTGLVVAGGWALQAWNSEPATTPHRHAEEKLKAEVDARFQQGIVMLHAKEYEHAMTAFHRVLQLAPAMPEAHVNTGFALVGMKRYPEAEAFFRTAMDLRPEQTNAYYGLAMALEGKGDLSAATAAMQTYMHLSKPDDRHRRKAEAAIWEWREALAGKSGDGSRSAVSK